MKCPNWITISLVVHNRHKIQLKKNGNSVLFKFLTIQFKNLAKLWNMLMKFNNIQPINFRSLTIEKIIQTCHRFRNSESGQSNQKGFANIHKFKTKVLINIRVVKSNLEPTP